MKLGSLGGWFWHRRSGVPAASDPAARQGFFCPDSKRIERNSDSRRSPMLLCGDEPAFASSRNLNCKTAAGLGHRRPCRPRSGSSSHFDVQARPFSSVPLLAPPVEADSPGGERLPFSQPRQAGGYQENWRTPLLWPWRRVPPPALGQVGGTPQSPWVRLPPAVARDRAGSGVL